MRKKFFWRPPPLISGSGWLPPPSPLIWRSGSATGSKGEAHVFLTSMLLWRTSPPQYVQASALLIQFFVLCWSRCLLSTDSPHAWHCSSPYWQISSCFCTNDRSQLVSKKNREQWRKLRYLPRSGRDAERMSSYSHVRKNVKNDLACVTPVVFSVVGLKKTSGWLFWQFSKFLWSEHRPVYTAPRHAHRRTKKMRYQVLGIEKCMIIALYCFCCSCQLEKKNFLKRGRSYFWNLSPIFTNLFNEGFLF